MSKQKLRPLPDRARLLAILRYEPETGKLFWRERPLSMFRDGGHSAEHVHRRWNTRYAGKEAFTTSGGQGRKEGAVGHVNYLAHRIIWKMVHGTEPVEIDHLDGDPSNNRLSNLRNGDHSDNMKNRRAPKLNAAGVTGIYREKRGGKWAAEIRSKGKKIFLGRFADKEDAVTARLKAETVYGFTPRHGRARR